MKQKKRILLESYKNYLKQKTKNEDIVSVPRELISLYLKIPVDFGREHMQYAHTRVGINGYSMFKLVYSKKEKKIVVMLHFYVSQVI